MYSAFSILYKTNRKLVKRSNMGRLYYLFYLAAGCLILAGLGIFTLFIGPETRVEPQNGIAIFVFLLVVFDVGSILRRYTDKATVEPGHLAVFPLSKWQKIKFQAALLLTDYKTLLYVTSFVLFSVYFIRQALYAATLIELVIWLSLLAGILSWSLAIYHMTGRFISRHRKHLQLFIFFCYGFLIFGIDVFGQNIMMEIPVIGNASNALFGLVSANLFMTVINSLALLCFAAAAWLIMALTESNC